MRILLIEPEALIAKALTDVFARERIACDVMGEDDARSLAPSGGDETLNYAAIVIGEVADPIDLSRWARRRFDALPVMALLGRRAPELAAGILDAGADDVLVKPVHSREIAARLRAVVRRAAGRAEPSEEIGALRIYFDGSDPEVHGQRLKLSGREHAIFMHLARNRGRVVGKESLYEAVYGLDGERPLGKVIDVYICKLRKKLASASGGENYIETVFNRGYKFDEPAHTDQFRALPAVEAFAA